MKLIVFVILVVIFALAILSAVKVVNTVYVYFVKRMGRFYMVHIEPQDVTTKDNVKISVDNVIFYKILNVKDVFYNAENYVSDIMYSTITNMRNIIGDMTLDEVLTGRDQINSKLLNIMDQVTDAYRIKIISVENKTIVQPQEIQ